MTTPPLDIAVEPLESGSVHYLPLGATKSGGTTTLKIIVRLSLHNRGSATVKISAIKFSFPGSIVATINMKSINTDASLDIAAAQTKFWSNGKLPDGDNFIYLTRPAPPRIKIEVSATGYTSAASVEFPLAPHKSPVSGGAYRIPYAAGDLGPSEYVEGSAVHWANGGSTGGQIYAHDIGWVGFANGSWSGLVPSGDSSKNAGYRIWGKPVRAMADGTVVEWLNTMDDNTVLGSFPTPTPSPGTGNHIYVRHGSEVVRYCHFQKGSIPAALQSVGATVLEGQVLGRAGNSGNTTNPHTHIEVETAVGTALRPFPWRDSWVIDRASITSPPSSSGPWYKLNQEGIPKEVVSIWPASTFPGYRLPGAAFSISGDWETSLTFSPNVASFRSTTQDLFDRKGLRLICASTYLENGSRRWAGISRAGDWANSWWVSTSLDSFLQTAQDYFDKSGLRLIYVSTFLDGSTRSWIGISRGGDWESRLTLESDLTTFSTKVQELFDTKGLRLIHVSTWTEGSTRRWLGISRTGTWANRWWISNTQAEFITKVQSLFDDEGKRLSYFSTYVEGGQRKWIGIARSGTWAHRFYIRNDLDALRLQAEQFLDNNALRCEQMEFLQ